MTPQSSSFFLIFILFFFLISTGNVSAKIYKYVNKNGVVEYSDTPKQGAQEIKLKPITIWHFNKSATPPKLAIKKELPSFTYKRISILSPANQTALYSTDGKLRVSIQIVPTLRTSDYLEFLVDGNPTLKSTNTQVTLKNLYRGTHQISANIVNGKGKVLLSSTPITITIHKPTILRRVR